MAYNGIDYLRMRLETKATRVKLRYDFYEMKHQAIDFQISTPPQLMWVFACLGWCGKAVDALADRLVFREFQNDNYDLTGIYRMNNPDILFDSAIQSALISACSFIYITPGEDDDIPRMQVIDGGNATGILDPITGMLTEGYAVLDRNEMGLPCLEAYYVPGRTDYIVNGELDHSLETNSPYPLLVPVIYRSDDRRPFGHSRISRACMNLQDQAMRTLKRAEISAEFYSYPQKWVTGLAEDAEPMEKWKAAMSAMIAFEKDEDGDSPTLGQFQAQSMAPHFEQLRMLASLFAGETGLTLDDLGFASGNPSSSEAIKSAHETLRLAARKAQRCFGVGFLNAGMTAATLRDDFAYSRATFYDTVPTWDPVFEPDGSALSGIGDALIKLDQVLPGYITGEKLRELTGL